MHTHSHSIPHNYTNKYFILDISSPDPDNPYMPELAKLYKEDRAAFENQVRAHVRKYAMWYDDYYTLSLSSNLQHLTYMTVQTQLIFTFHRFL